MSILFKRDVTRKVETMNLTIRNIQPAETHNMFVVEFVGRISKEELEVLLKKENGGCVDV